MYPTPASSVIDAPAQLGFVPAVWVITGVGGRGLTMTAVVAGADVQPATVTVTL